MSIRLKDEAAVKAASATKLATARTINGTNFDGSANITTSNWGTARNITIGNTAKSVNGSGNVSWSLSEIGAVGLASPAFTGTPTAPTAAAGTNSTQLATTAFVTTAVNNKTSVSGNAGTATKLATARTINGTSFDGTANITTANWGTARTLTIGNTGKSVNGSGNVSWSLSEIGALPLTGGTVTGATIFQQGTRIHQANASSGTTGYLHVAQFKITGAYQNQGIYIGLTQRSRDYQTLEINFSSVNTNDPTLTSFVRTGNINAYMYKSATSTWDLYIQKTEAHDYIDILEFHKGGYMSGVTVTWKNALVSSVPTGYVQASVKNAVMHITGNSATATALQTARTINGTSFNGSANITTANWGTARTITIGNSGKSVNGSSNVSWTLAEIGAAATSHNHGLLHSDFTVQLANTTTDSGWSMINSSYSGFLLKSIRTQASAPAWIQNNYAAGIAFGGADTKGVLSVAYTSPSIRFAGGNSTKPTWYLTLTGTSAKTYNMDSLAANTANTLATARTINGTSFNGSANITTANWGTARTLTIGNSGKSVNGSANVSWSLSEIGALPLTGGTLSGRLTANGKISLPTTAGSWISGMTLTNAPLTIATQQTTSSYHPVLAVKTSGGHVANLGGLGDNFGFYGFESGRTANATDWSFAFNVSTGNLTFSDGELFIKNNTTGKSGHIWNGSGGFVVQAEADANLHLGANNNSNHLVIYGNSADSNTGIHLNLATLVKGGLALNNNYLELYPFNSSYGSGSRAQIWYNATDRKLNLQVRNNSDSSVSQLNLNCAGQITCGSLSTGGIVKSGNIEMNGANTIRNSANGIWINGTSPDYPSYLGTLVVTADSAGGRVHSQAVYNRKFTAGANMHINTAYTIGYTSSARKYKLDIMDIEKDQHEKILDLVPKSWFDRTTTEQYAHYLTRRSRGENVSLEDEGIGYLDRVNGLVAEDVEEVGLGNFVNYGNPDEDGNREVLGIQYDRLWTLLIPLVREQREAIKDLKEVVREQQAQISELKDLIQDKTA